MIPRSFLSKIFERIIEKTKNSNSTNMKFALGIFLILFLHVPLCAQDSLVQIPIDILNTTCITYELFQSDNILEICLSGNIRKLFKDRNDNARYHPILLTYKLASGDSNSLKIEVKTRGHFRRKRENCFTPPLFLKFDTAQIISNTIFNKQTKLKLVTACIDEKYVLREYLVYKIYQLITEKSFNVRLVKVCFDNIEKIKKQPISLESF